MEVDLLTLLLNACTFRRLAGVPTVFVRVLAL